LPAAGYLAHGDVPCTGKRRQGHFPRLADVEHLQRRLLKPQGEFLRRQFEHAAAAQSVKVLVTGALTRAGRQVSNRLSVAHWSSLMRVISSASMTGSVPTMRNSRQPTVRLWWKPWCISGSEPETTITS